MLKVDGLGKKISGRWILQDVSFNLPERGITALLGPNGAGKTTLMRLLIGFYEADHGSVNISGYGLQTQRLDAVRKVAYVPETGGLYPEMSVFEYLKFMADIRHVALSDFSSRIVGLTKALDLSEVLAQKCETLSKGFSRRVAIAGALISAPDILILDEPCEGLDVKQKIRLRTFLREYSKSCSILISTHIMEDVEALADNILLLSKGHLLYDGSLQELKTKAKKISVEDSFFSLVEG